MGLPRFRNVELIPISVMTHVASPVINSVPLVVSVEMNTVNYKPRLTQRVLRFAVFRRRKFSNL